MVKTNSRIITRVGAILVVAAMVASGLVGWPTHVQAAPTEAPNFVGITHWINSRPLTMKELRGKVVLIDFWAYSCINCLRSLPHVIHWYNQYKDKGFVVVGVHSPEFKFGMHLKNVERAVKHFHIDYPVAMDSNMDTWRAWHNEFWPAEYLVNRQGKVVLHHFGEGQYLEMENAIRKQLGLAPTHHAIAGVQDLRKIGSPEMYFGLAREQYIANAHDPSQQPYQYHAPDALGLNRFALQGLWRVTPRHAELLGNHGEIRLHFDSGKLYMVASSDRPVTLAIMVDGKKQAPVTVHASKLYTLFQSNAYREHTVTIHASKPGLRAFTFTFG